MGAVCCSSSPLSVLPPAISVVSNTTQPFIFLFQTTIFVIFSIGYFNELSTQTQPASQPTVQRAERSPVGFRFRISSFHLLGNRRSCAFVQEESAEHCSALEKSIFFAGNLWDAREQCSYL